MTVWDSEFAEEILDGLGTAAVILLLPLCGTTSEQHMNILISVLITALGLATGIGSVYAHSFTVALIAPPSGTNMEFGEHVQVGLLGATRERDSQPNEEPDGHLGGFNVYLLLINGALEPRGVSTAVAMLRHAQRIEFIAAISLSRTEELSRIDAGTKTVLIELSKNVMSKDRPIISDRNSSVFESEFH